MRGISCGGLKKCIPMTFSGFFVADPRRVMLIEDVFEASTVSAPRCSETCRYRSSFSSGSSVAASITSCEPSSAVFRSVVGWILARMFSAPSCVRVPLATNLARLSLTMEVPLSRNSCLTSNNDTS